MAQIEGEEAAAVVVVVVVLVVDDDEVGVEAEVGVGVKVEEGVKEEVAPNPLGLEAKEGGEVATKRDPEGADEKEGEEMEANPVLEPALRLGLILGAAAVLGVLGANEEVGVRIEEVLRGLSAAKGLAAAALLLSG